MVKMCYCGCLQGTETSAFRSIPVRPLELSFDNKIVGKRLLLLCLSCLLSRGVVQLIMDLEYSGTLVPCSVYIYTARVRGMLAHVQSVCTRPFLLPSKGLSTRLVNA